MGRQMTDDHWGKLRQRLLKTVGQNNFTTWIEPLDFAGIEEGVAVFHVPTNFTGNYVGQTFSDLILHEFAVAGHEVKRLLFKVAGKGEKRVEALRIAEIFRASVVDSTLESFVFEITGTPEKLDAFADLMRPLGLSDQARTGVAALARGA